MNFLTVFSFLTFYVLINSSIDCFFIPNPINWFRKSATELPENMTVSSLNTTIASISDPVPTQSYEELFQMAINQSRPIQPLVSLASTQPNSLADRLNKPFTLAMLGMPVKANRFGLEPLPYPKKTSQSKFEIFDDQNLKDNLILNRRFGELLPETTTQTQTTETVKQLEVTTTELINSYEINSETTTTSTTTMTPTSTSTSTPTSTSETTTQSESTTNTLIGEYNRTTESPELELKTETTVSEEVSPKPVYKPMSPSTDELLVINSSEERTTKPSLEVFVSNLNNMYYRSDDIFESMMKDLDQFKGRSFQN